MQDLADAESQAPDRPRAQRPQQQPAAQTITPPIADRTQASPEDPAEAPSTCGPSGSHDLAQLIKHQPQPELSRTASRAQLATALSTGRFRQTLAASTAADLQQGVPGVPGGPRHPAHDRPDGLTAGPGSQAGLRQRSAGWPAGRAGRHRPADRRRSVRPAGSAAGWPKGCFIPASVPASRARRHSLIRLGYRPSRRRIAPFSRLGAAPYAVGGEDLLFVRGAERPPAGLLGHHPDRRSTVTRPAGHRHTVEHGHGRLGKLSPSPPSESRWLLEGRIPRDSLAGRGSRRFIGMGRAWWYPAGRLSC
jgi:hypothetical protein